MVMHKDSHPFTTSGRPKSSWRSLWIMPMPFPLEVEFYQMLSSFVRFFMYQKWLCNYAYCNAKAGERRSKLLSFAFACRLQNLVTEPSKVGGFLNLRLSCSKLNPTGESCNNFQLTVFCTSTSLGDRLDSVLRARRLLVTPHLLLFSEYEGIDPIKNWLCGQ